MSGVARDGRALLRSVALGALVIGAVVAVGVSGDSTTSAAAPATLVPGSAWPDFDGGGVADRSVFRPEFGGWFVEGQPTAFLGLSGDVPVPADYDGDGTTEQAVFRGGAWFIEGEETRFLGTATDIPVPGDYDGDGDWEPAVYRNGAWFIEGQTTRYLGLASDVPVPGDYNGDGTTEVAVFRPSVGGWYVDGATPVFYGLSTDVPVPADYDGDGSTDRAVYRPEFGGWYVDGLTTEFIGLSTDVPVPADYDGDGSVERAVYRPEFGGWYVQDATTVFYGLSTDVPLSLPAAVYEHYFNSPVPLVPPMAFEAYSWETDACYSLLMPYAVSPNGRYAVVYNNGAGWCFSGVVGIELLDREARTTVPTPIEMDVPDIVAVDDSGRVLAGPYGGPFAVWETGPTVDEVSNPCASSLGSEFYAFPMSTNTDETLTNYCVRGSSEVVQANRASTGNRYLVLIGTDTSTWFDSSEKNSGTFPDAMHEWITGPGADESCGAGTVVLDNQTIGRVDSCPGSAAQNASAAFEARDFDGQVVEYHSEPDLGSWGQAGVATWSATGRGYAFGYQELTLVDLDRGTREVAGASTAGEYEGLCFGQRNSGSIFWHNRIVCGG